MRSNRVLIIAEAGVNHNGSLANAKALIDVAASAGADIVKFQTFKAQKIVSKTAKKADYQVKNLQEDDDSQYAMLKKLEIPEEWYSDLLAHAKEKNIIFLSTGFDEESIDFLDQMNMPFFKIPSGEITNKPYLLHIAAKKKPVMISTGMANMEEVRTAVDLFVNAGISKADLSVLHCNTEYPTPFEDVNMLAMNTIGKELGVAIGYSDHTKGIEVPVAAVALGARVIEKHFTLDRSMPGPDHAASLEPDELHAMVRSIRNIELAISGNGVKEPSPSEKKNKDIVRKSLHFNRSMNEGETITAADVIALRPGNGISPMQIEEVLGKTLTQSVDEFKMIDPSFFQ